MLCFYLSKKKKIAKIKRWGVVESREFSDCNQKKVRLRKKPEIWSMWSPQYTIAGLKRERAAGQHDKECRRPQGTERLPADSQQGIRDLKDYTLKKLSHTNNLNKPEVVSSLLPPEGMLPCRTLISAFPMGLEAEDPAEPHCNCFSNLRNCETINGHYFKPLDEYTGSFL